MDKNNKSQTTAMDKLLSNVAFDEDGDLLFLKMILPELCQLSEDDRLFYRIQLIDLIRKYLNRKKKKPQVVIILKQLY